MNYESTRGESPRLGFDDVLLTGLAPDGGLYIPEHWPQFSAKEIARLPGLPYAELAARVMGPFVAGSAVEAEFDAVVAEAYSEFEHAAVVPLKQLEPSLWLMEQFHGPTLAFKDLALQLLGRLFDRVLKARGERVTVVGATSGDTGSAAIEACRDREQIDIFILHPKGRVSEVQRRQMTTVDARNVHNIAIEGSFDDCQDLVKAMFNDAAFRREMRLSAVNSINWARIMALIAYYFAAAVALGAPQRAVEVAVPTGNFGNVYAAYAARRMGLPIDGFVVGSNRNDILTRFFESGTMQIAEVEPSYSPSMDIQVSSNFERLLFDLFEGDGEQVKHTLTQFRKTGRFEVAANSLRQALALFAGHRLDDPETLAEIRRIHAETGELVDPHTAVGIAAARSRRGAAETPMIALATAHPAKFPDAVEEATGIRPALPERLADLFEKPERMESLSNDLDAVQAHIRAAVSEALPAG
ncbi:MAG: threonine synthase [Rhodovibrionaceae bacterium]|nr:threonine synthase [Rhodovibrionaceae bacterium]